MAKTDMTQPQLIQAVKVLIEKGQATEEKAEQYYISAGQHLHVLKAKHNDKGGKWADWQALVKEKIGISSGRASHLMQIADGRKSLEEVKTRSRESQQKTRSLRHRKENSEEQEQNDPKPVTGFYDGLSGGSPSRALTVVKKSEPEESLKDQLDKDNEEAPFLAFASRVGVAWQMGCDAEKVLLPGIVEVTKPNRDDWDDMIQRLSKTVEQWTLLLNKMKSMDAPASRRRKRILKAA